MTNWFLLSKEHSSTFKVCYVAQNYLCAGVPASQLHSTVPTYEHTDTDIEIEISIKHSYILYSLLGCFVLYLLVYFSTHLCRI